jgi:CrcB protein
MKFGSVLVLGILGVFCRFVLSSFIQSKIDSPLPISTLIINVLGCFLMGVVYVLGVEKSLLSDSLKAGLMAGLLGGFTTFSTYSLELVQFLRSSLYFNFALYFLLSQFLGVSATFFGIFMTKLCV